LRLGVYLGWHVHPWEELLALAQLAEELGYDAVFVDGDATLHPGRETLDGWTAPVPLLARTRRIAVGSLRLVHYWNAARLAQSIASAERIAPGRLRFLASIGDRPIDARFGLPDLPPAERIRWLDETLDAARALWRGEAVTRRGRHVKLEGARLCPAPPGGRIEVAVAAKGPRMLELVARHADVWEVNLPAVAGRIATAAGALAAACERLGRDPAGIERSLLFFTRLAASPDPAPFLPEFRRLNPWFAPVPDAEAGASLVVGPAGEGRERLRERARALRITRPVLDLSGFPAGPTGELLHAFAPEK